jgi:flagella basal body P-ring formation protein FlgA
MTRAKTLAPTLAKTFVSVIALAVSMAGAALAGVPVDLRSEPAAAGDTVTLGDLFDGAGRAGQTPLATARAGSTSLVLDAGQIQRVAHINGLDWDNPKGFRRVVVQVGAGAAAAPSQQSAQQSAQQSVSGARSEKTVEVLTLTHSLAAGDVVQPQDVIWTKVQSHMAPNDAPSDAAQVIGQSARRPLREGAALAAHDLASPVVIRRDQLVTVAYVTDGIELTVQGKAGSDASVGQSVEIINTQSKKTIAAIATGPGRAVTGPGAEGFRSRSFAAR